MIILGLRTWPRGRRCRDFEAKVLVARSLLRTHCDFGFAGIALQSWFCYSCDSACHRTPV